MKLISYTFSKKFFSPFAEKKLAKMNWLDKLLQLPMDVISKTFSKKLF